MRRIVYCMIAALPLISCGSKSSDNYEDDDDSATTEDASSSWLGGKERADAVDLGLSVLWADRNVGASSPSDYGGYYAWGETSTKSDYSWDTYQYFHDQDGNGVPYDSNWNTQANELTNIGSNIAGSRYDVARQAWGGGWKLPTMAQWEELANRCTWIMTTQGGHSGYKVTGPNGNSIFLPAAGYRDGTSSVGVGRYGFYWSATLYESSTSGAWFLVFNSGGHYVESYYRSDGFTVRPVTEK